MELLNLQEEYKNTQIDELLRQLDADLIGLVPVKTRIKEIAALLLINCHLMEKQWVPHIILKLSRIKILIPRK